MAGSREEWELGIPSGFINQMYPVWTGHQSVPGGIADMETLFLWASKAFNWLKKPENCNAANNCLTLETSTVLVAVFYDAGTNEIFASTIPRTSYAQRMNNPRGGPNQRDLAPKWRGGRARGNNNTPGQLRTDAEDGAYFLREALGGPGVGQTYTPGSKIAVWGLKGTTYAEVATSKGRPYGPCENCQRTATQLGVQWVDVQEDPDDRPLTPVTRGKWEKDLLEVYGIPLDPNRPISTNEVWEMIELARSVREGSPSS